MNFEKVDIYGYFSGWYAIEKQLNEYEQVFTKRHLERRSTEERLV